MVKQQRKPIKNKSLTIDEHHHLHRFATTGGLTGKMPEEIQQKMTEHGYIKYGLGGHVLTEKGAMILSNNGDDL